MPRPHLPEFRRRAVELARLRDAGLLSSMGSIGDCFDNSVAEAFFSGLQRELLDQHD